METKKKKLEEAKKFLEKLKTNEKSVLFSEEKLNKKLLKKLKKSKYSNDKKLLKLIDLAENNIEQFNENNENIVPARLNYVEEKEIDRSTLCSLDSPFQLMHPDITNLEFLGKSATAPRYALLIVGLYSSKYYVYPIQSRKQLLKYINEFYLKLIKKLVICVFKQKMNFSRQNKRLK